VFSEPVVLACYKFKFPNSNHKVILYPMQMMKIEGSSLQHFCFLGENSPSEETF
jgi:hypothetical protein